jgi:hypothetical protein
MRLVLLVLIPIIFHSCNERKIKTRVIADSKSYSITKADVTNDAERMIDSTVYFIQNNLVKVDSVQNYLWTQNSFWKRSSNKGRGESNIYLKRMNSDNIFVDPCAVFYGINDNLSIQDYVRLEEQADSVMIYREKLSVTTELIFNNVSQTLLLHHYPSSNPSTSDVNLERAIYTTDHRRRLRKVEYYFSDGRIEQKIIEHKNMGSIVLNSKIILGDQIFDHKRYAVYLKKMALLY